MPSATMSHPSVARRRSRPRRREIAPPWNPERSVKVRTGLSLGGNESYPNLFQPYGGFPDSVRVEKGHVVMPNCRASAWLYVWTTPWVHGCGLMV